MSFIEDYNMIISHQNIFYRRLANKKMGFHKPTKEELDEGIMIPFRANDLYFSFKTKTSLIPLQKQFSRAGVIPYTIKDGKKYFLLGIDAKFGTLTDFGGGVKRGENFIEAACRELDEESLGIFNFLHPERMKEVRQNSTTVYDDNSAIIFLNVSVDSMNDVCGNFPKS